MGIRIRSGRNITSDPADQLGAFIVNQAFLKHTGLSNGLGVDITAFDHKGKIVGIVDDFHYRSIHNLVEPLVMIYNTSPPEHITVKLQSNNVANLKDKWQKLYPGYPFDYFFLDESFEKQYEKDRSTATVFTLFTVLIALISFFGLYALLSVNIFQRTKEIGIRVVLGASGKNISTLMFRDYLIILFVAIMIAAPITWILMNKWLEEFAYRNQIQWWIFAVAGIVTLVISSIIVFLKVFKVIVSNPVNALRTE